MKDNEIMKLRCTKFFTSPWVHSFHFFILEVAWVVWEIFSPPPELSPSLDRTGWGGGYGYAGGGGYVYGWGAGPPDEPPVGEEGMNMVEVEGTDMVDEHFHPMNHRPEVEGMDAVEEHFHPMNHQPEVEDMDMVDIGMREDRAAELEVVERETEGGVLVRHWIGDRAPRHHRLIGSGRGLWNRGVQKIKPCL
jgi:hypothetical protein